MISYRRLPDFCTVTIIQDPHDPYVATSISCLDGRAYDDLDEWEEATGLTYQPPTLTQVACKLEAALGTSAALWANLDMAWRRRNG